MIDVKLNSLPREAFEARLICPCGGENLHLGPVTVAQDDVVETIGPRGTEILHEKNTVAPRKRDYPRGSVVAVRLWCEEGHEMAMVFGFHKGITCVQLKGPREVQSAPPDYPYLWRN